MASPSPVLPPRRQHRARARHRRSRCQGASRRHRCAQWAGINRVHRDPARQFTVRSQREPIGGI